MMPSQYHLRIQAIIIIKVDVDLMTINLLFITLRKASNSRGCCLHRDEVGTINLFVRKTSTLCNASRDKI